MYESESIRWIASEQLNESIARRAPRNGSEASYLSVPSRWERDTTGERTR